MQLNHRVGDFEYPMPEGFKDDSNGNDICASIYSESLGLKIFIDHKDPEAREEPNYPRFAVYKTNDDGEVVDHVDGLFLQSENWLTVIDKINSL